jgi:formamidopyrimidine-DNA glycosylase
VPELPEVESVVRSIRNVVVDCKITKFDLFPNLEGKEIDWVDRRGKYIIFCIEGDYLVSHLRMTGQWFVSIDKPDDKHYRWGMDLEGRLKHQLPRAHLWFKDARKFGTIDLVENSLANYKPIAILGPDGLEPDAEHVKKKLSKSRKPIKNILMDQSVLAGPGNIYVSEVLWDLKIHPEKPAKDCADKSEDICRLFKDTFLEAIKHGGSSISDYLGGEYHKRLKVYGREGKPCRDCGTNISRIVQSGRSTFYCSNCQV